MSILIFLEDDGIINYQTVVAQGTVIAEGLASVSQRTYNNAVEYTASENVSETAEYRHLSTSNRDSIHRR